MNASINPQEYMEVSINEECVIDKDKKLLDGWEH